MNVVVKQKNIRFPNTVIAVLEREGKKLGYTFNEYVRYIATKKAEKIMHDDAQLRSDIIQARTLSKQGKLPTAQTDDEINSYVDSVLNEKIQN